MVIGPTPPGTGVMAEARLLASANSTSPTSFFSPTRFTPTSITTAPSFIPFDHLRFAGSGDQDVGHADPGGEIPGSRMAEGNSGVLLQAHERHRFADNIGAADHNHLLAGQINPRFLQHHHHAVRGAGSEERFAYDKAPDVIWGENRPRPLSGRRSPAPFPY